MFVSDGVFAITITLLVLEIRPPTDYRELLHGLGEKQAYRRPVRDLRPRRRLSHKPLQKPGHRLAMGQQWSDQRERRQSLGRARKRERDCASSSHRSARSHFSRLCATASVRCISDVRPGCALVQALAKHWSRRPRRQTMVLRRSGTADPSLPKRRGRCESQRSLAGLSSLVQGAIDGQTRC
jgi:hypothetical protein